MTVLSVAATGVRVDYWNRHPGDLNNNYGLWVGVHSTGIPYDSGVRFMNVTVPKDATITSATFSGPQTCNGQIYSYVQGEDTDSAKAITSASDAYGRTATSQSNVYNPGLSGTFNLDVKSIIQEITTRSGWASGGNIRIFFFVREGLVPPENYFYSAGASEYVLQINYSAGWPRKIMTRSAPAKVMSVTPIKIMTI